MLTTITASLLVAIPTVLVWIAAPLTLSRTALGVCFVCLVGWLCFLGLFGRVAAFGARLGRLLAKV